jgi:glycosyltransferase involved in cell wall biosynthesis
MKIGLCHNLYGGLSRGGAETAVALAAEELCRAGYEVFLITTKPAGYTPDSVSRRAAYPVYYLESGYHDLDKHGGLFRLSWQIANIFSFKKYRQIKKILIAAKPDLVITHNLMGLGFLVPLALRRLKIRQEHFLHDIQLLHPSGLMIWGQEKRLRGLSAKIYRSLTKALFGSPAKVISPSKWLLQEHNKYGFFPASEKEIRPFVWPEAEIKKTIRTDKETRFLFIGQIEEQKGVFLLIDAFRKTKEADFRLTFAIRGGGSGLAEAKRLAGDDARINFLGPLSYEETERIKIESDYLVVPSLCYENSPTVIYGAKAVGLPIIASDIGGIPELLGERDRLFKPGDIGDLKQKIEEDKND